MSKRLRRSMIGTMVPRRFSTPCTCGGACGMRVTWVQPRISWTLRMSRPYSSPARRKVRYWPAPATCGAGEAGDSSREAVLITAPCQRLCCEMLTLMQPFDFGRVYFFPGELYQAWDIENQRHCAVTQNRGAGKAVDTAEIGFDALDDDLLLAEQLIYEQPGLHALALHDDQQAFKQVPGAGLGIEYLIEAQYRQVILAQANDLRLAGHDADHVFAYLDGLDDGNKRNDVVLVADAHGLAVEDRERERQADGDGRAPPFLRGDL